MFVHIICYNCEIGLITGSICSAPGQRSSKSVPKEDLVVKSCLKSC